MGAKKQYILWFIQLIVWVAIAIFFSLPSYDWTVGVFHSGDGSIIVPMIYSSIINALIFYGNAHYLIRAYLAKKQKGKYWLMFVGAFVGLTILECVLDAAWYISFYEEINASIYEEVFISNFFLNGLLFAFPSFFYRFTLDWSKQASQIESGVTESLVIPGIVRKEADEVLLIKSGKATYKVPLKQIEFVESSGNDIIYHYAGEQLSIRDSLTKLADSLPSNIFVRCHKSFIVSKLYVNKVDYDFIYLTSKQIPIGRVYRENVNQILA